MKGILGMLRPKAKAEPDEDRLDSVLFTTAFAGQGVDADLLVPWEARAAEVGATRLSPNRGTMLLQALWGKDKFMRHLDNHAISRLERFFDFATVSANRDIIRQDEYGNFMVVVLSGKFWAKCRYSTVACDSPSAPPSQIARSPFSVRKPWMKCSPPTRRWQPTWLPCWPASCRFACA